MKVFIIGLSVSVFLAAFLWVEKPSLLKNNQQSLIESAKEANEMAFLNDKIKPVDAMPNSLIDVDHGVILKVDTDGNLIVNRRLRDLFEFYLSAMGEEPLAVILNRIHGEFHVQLPELAIMQAKSLLKNYVDYRIELAQVNENLELLDVKSLSQTERLKLQKNEISQLRNQYFNDKSYQAFFEKEDALDQYMLRQLEIAENPELSPEQKQLQISALESTLPEKEQQLRKKVSQHADLSAQVKKMRSAGNSDEEIFQHRAQSLGAEAAQNLANLDKKREQWNARLKSYALKRNEILASGLSGVDANDAISELIQKNFSAREGLRVKALDNSL